MAQDNPGSARSRGDVLPFPPLSAPSSAPSSASRSTVGTLEAALEHLYRNHYDELYRFAAHYVGEHEAEEIVHAAIAEVFDRARNAPPEKPLEVHIRLVQNAVRFRVIDYRNTVKRRESLLVLYVEDFKARVGRWLEPKEIVEQSALSRAIAAAVATMPPLVCEIYVLHHEAGLQPKEISDRTGRSHSAVRALISRGNTILRDHLERAGFSRARVRQGGAR